MSSTPRQIGHAVTTPTGRPWESPKIRPVGRLGDVLKGGQGKVTVVTGDPGEPQKVPAHEN